MTDCFTPAYSQLALQGTLVSGSRKQFASKISGTHSVLFCSRKQFINCDCIVWHEKLIYTITDGSS